MEIYSGVSLFLLLISGLVAAHTETKTFTFNGTLTGGVAAFDGTKTFAFTGTGTVENDKQSSDPHPNNPTPEDSQLKALKARDCSDILAANSSAQDGVYTITPSVGTGSIDVFCDMSNNGGGNENIYRITNQHGYSIRFDLEDFTKGKRYALYYHFYIDGEDEKYRLHVHGYTGDAGESLANIHNEMAFSTKDRDNDIDSSRHCSQVYLGGWWYGNCHHVNLNGQYNNTAPGKGIFWRSFSASLKHTTMKIRP